MLPHLPHILMTVDFLMELASQHQGHLPSSLPARDRSHPYVQICHGSPGLLMLLATIRSTHPEEFEGIRRRHPGVRTGVMNAVWEQGLVQKGLGICHGVTGNAGPIMLLSVGDNALSPSSSTSSDDLQLSRALAFLVHATELPPLSTQSRLPYRTPDHPFSLFEGLSGAVCAWADACTIIEARLSNGRQISPVLGLPGLGGVGLISIM
ncbi:hypothetical protein FRB94_005454 [Tulasnella sp. JGI-2019a]|nr:hypothetical protein FRB94_005454 [Tulasnella sp. JGI-2019a]